MSVVSLPSGYKQLEYIQSSGTQYINSNFKPNQNTRAIASVIADSSDCIFGTANGYGDGMYSFIGLGNNGFRSDFGNTLDSVTISESILKSKFEIDKDKNATAINGFTMLTSAANTFQCVYPLFIGAFNNAGAVLAISSIKIFWIKIYDNGTLIRDFIPCQTAAGEIGLWDNVNSVFYGNAGTGSFIAGPEVKPSIPSNFTAVVSNGVVSLSWSGSEKATGYRLSRDGVQISDQTGTTYTETLAKNQSYTYSLIAYNDAGDSDPATLTVTVPLEPPAAPTGLAASVSHGVVSMSWNAAAKATGYRLYRDGTLLADQTGTGYTDNVGAAGEYAYTLIAYNDDGDSPEATLTVTVVLPPSAPAELRMTARTRTTISLAWDTVAGAAGYRLYRDGVQIYGGTEASYTDTGLSAETSYTYAVEAFNSGGVSGRTTLETATIGLILIIDRTQRDVDRVRELAGKLNAGTATVEELAEWNSIALKGSYDHTDLNRVGDAVQYISEILKSCGYHCPVIPKLDWPESGSVSPSDMAQYLQNVQTLRGILTLLPETPDVPADMEKLTWQEANAIEQILVDLDTTIKTMLKTRVACGDAYCGGDYL